MQTLTTRGTMTTTMGASRDTEKHQLLQLHSEETWLIFANTKTARRRVNLASELTGDICERDLEPQFTMSHTPLAAVRTVKSALQCEN